MTASGPTPHYAFGSTDAEHERLIWQASHLAPLTERLFREAGIGPGQRVLDLGSGVGDVAMLVARLVGPSGEIVGAERDTRSIARARARVAEAGLHNVSFTESDVNHIANHKPFDAAVGRFILEFLPDPLAALRSVSRLVRPGSGFLFCPDRLWTARAGSNALCYQTLYISLHKLMTLAAQMELTGIQLARLSGVHALDSETSEAAHKAYTIFEARSSLLERVASLVALAAMVASARRLVQTGGDEPRVSRVRSFLQEHLSEHIEISRLAEIVSLTPCHFIRVFHRAVGVPLHRYVTLVRIRHAESLLRAGVPLAEAADSAGFYDQSHLSRHFRRILGVTPGQYQSARFLRARPVITCEKVMAYRLRSGEKLLRHWAKLRAARGYPSCLCPPVKAPHSSQ